LELSLALDKHSGDSLQSQVFEQVRSMILKGQLKPGMMLAPSRHLAGSMAISRNTVMLAYERLAAEGYVESRGTIGTFVSSVLPDDLLRAGRGRCEYQPIRNAAGEMPSPLLCFAGYPAGPHLPRSVRPVYDFWPGRSDPSTFPTKVWRRIMVRKLLGGGFNLTEYGDPAGLEELRVAIASHLGRSRGMSVTADQVIITSGSQDGLNLICRLVDRQKHPFFIEDPCYQGAAYLFQTIAAELHPVPVDENGLIVDCLPRDRPGVLFVTPSHQYPTGATLSLQRRLYLLKWAQDTNSFIIEDDYDSDFRYEGRPLTALAGLDGSKRVLYLGTFSKSLGAGLRLGYAVVPDHLAKSARVVKSQMSSGQAWLDQAVVAEFLKSGLFDRHLRRIRQLYKSRRDCLRDSLERYFGKVEIYGADGGLHVVWRLPPGSPDAEVVELAARKKGLGLYALHSGAAYSFGKSRQDLVVLGYSSVKERDIERPIKRLYDVLDKLVARPSKGRRRSGLQHSASRSRPLRQNGRQYLVNGHR
jgi:GntR family transcriptional regulator/MocR family aminotransferase